MLGTPMPALIDPRAHAQLRRVVRTVAEASGEVFKLHATGQSIANAADRERYASALQEALDHLARANRILEELVTRQPSAPP